MSGNWSQWRGCHWRAPGRPSARGGFLRALLGGVAVVLFGLAVSPVQAGQLNFIPDVYSDGRAHTGIYLADMTGDGVVDVLVGDRQRVSLKIYRYTSDGNYAERIDEIVFPAEVHDVKAADLDKDGDLDLVVALRSAGVRVVENTGGPGVVGSWQITALDWKYAWQVLVGDLDGDGNLDIVDCQDYGPIVPFYGDGQGGFAAGVPIADPDTGMRFSMGFNLLDHNGDGRPDLIGVDGAYLRAFVNPGNRAAPWASVGNVLIGNYPSLRPRQAAANVGPSAGDLNGDGHIDQVAFVGTPDEPGATQLLILEGDGVTWTPRLLDTLPWHRFAGHIGVADLNGDGHLDIHAGGGQYFAGLRVYLGDGLGHFRREDIRLGYGVGGLNGFAAGDVNGDGRADIVASRFTPGGRPEGGFAILLANGQARTNGFWTGECIECQPALRMRSITQSSLKIDAQGNPHMALGGADLFYIRRSGQNWQREVVQLGLGLGIESVSLALDTAGQPHVSYAMSSDDSLRYAHRTAAGWQIEIVEFDLGYEITHTSLALDAQGRPHIAYTAMVEDYGQVNAIKYAYKDQSEWLTEVVAAEGYQPSLAVAGTTPHVSFIADEVLQYAVRAAGNGWDVTPVGDESGRDPSLALSSAGQARIAYVQAGAIKLATYAASDWNVDIVAPAGENELPVLALGQSDAVHVGYIAGASVRHAYRSGGAWQSALVVASDAYHLQFSLAAGPDGKPHAVYNVGATFATLKVARADGPAGGWVWGSGESVLEDTFLNRPSLALDTAARPAVSYCDYKTGAVVFARREAAGWARQVVDDLSGECRRSMLAIDGAGKAHVAYTVGNDEGEITKLIYARQTVAGWAQEVVETSPSPGFALAVDASAQPHLVYGHSLPDATTPMYAYRATTGWQRSALAADVTGSFTPTIVLDRQGRPHVAYTSYGPPNRAVHYAYRDAAGWHTETLQSSAELIFWYAQLALGSDGAAHVIYTSEENEEWITTHYARRGANGWQTEVVRRVGYSEYTNLETLLALGPDNRPYALNSSHFDEVVTLGVRGNAGWQWERLSATFTNGDDFTVDAAGVIHLAASYDYMVYLTARPIQPPLGDPEGYLSAGEYHTCGLRPDGRADCWGAGGGSGNAGQAADQSGPFVQVGAGALHSCGLRPNGRVDCWGSNAHGQAAGQAGPFKQLSGGGDHTCGLLADGRAVCWGRDTRGETVDWAGPFVQIGAGWQFTCGLLVTGGVICWGRNDFGQATDQAGPFTQLSVGWGHACGLQANGGVHCWGRNDHGQATDQAGPFTQISAGGPHTCGLMRDGRAACWGLNTNGQAEGRQGPFVQISAGGTWDAGAAPWGHTCGVRTTGAVECWGSNGDGQAAGPGGSFGPFGPTIRLPIILRSR